ncbi:MAG: septation protein A [Kordiimonadaceae bacterium]|jgi:intracellular septation protein|nr:septation protein A [Kordiimonadaceae bacterium]MBT6032919.1 septation protein A [Kordiimonadaceae bacterium]
MKQIIKLLIEMGPLVVFFYANSHYADETGAGGIIPATKIFMVAMAISMVCSKIFLKKIATMLWVSAFLVGIFGGLTIYFESELFIKIKPTILYSLFSIILLGGYARGKPLLKNLMEAGFPPMEQIAWMKMSRNFGYYFIGCAILNEIVWRNFTNEEWLWAKLWIFMPLSFIFMMTQMPMVMKHQIEEPEKD